MCNVDSKVKKLKQFIYHFIQHTESTKVKRKPLRWECKSTEHLLKLVCDELKKHPKCFEASLSLSIFLLSVQNSCNDSFEAETHTRKIL